MTSTPLAASSGPSEGDARFEFGANWRRFLDTVDAGRIRTAEESMARRLGTSSLAGSRFVDVGCGSGLFSLAARNLGATVHSFDVDPQSVACTMEIKRRFRDGDPHWVIEAGSALDQSYLQSLGQFDVVYSWGVLHHTGAMWEALANVAALVAPSGRLFISIYNDQRYKSVLWKRVKRAYVNSPLWAQKTLVAGVFCQIWIPKILLSIARGNGLSAWRDYRSDRGMSAWHDLIDWVGGYPFEVAKPEEVFAFFRRRGFILEELKTCGGSLGCNEYVFSAA